MTTPSEVYDFLTAYLEMDRRDREHFVVLSVSSRGEVIGCHEVSRGDLTSSAAHPREIFKAAILANAAGIILAHNHPSGDSAASDTDIETTERLKEAGDLLGIPVIDHIIIGSEGYTSLRSEHKF